MSLLAIILCIAATVSPAQGKIVVPDDIGQPYPGNQPSAGVFPGLHEIQTMVDFSIMYTDLRGMDMRGSYGGLPQLGAGLSFATSDRTRFFISARYGRQSGDPYHDIDGLSDPNGITLEAVPLMIGMKINASRRQDFRLYVGGAFQYTFLWEDVTTGDVNDNPMDIEAYGTSTGYYLFIGPEFPLGLGNSALGAEFGFGGSKGDVTASSHSHGVDLTGVHVRVYFTFGL